MGPRDGLDGCGKSRLPTGIRSPDCPVRSESLYGLSYPSPYIYLCTHLNLQLIKRRENFMYTCLWSHFCWPRHVESETALSSALTHVLNLVSSVQLHGENN